MNHSFILPNIYSISSKIPYSSNVLTRGNTPCTTLREQSSRTGKTISLWFMSPLRESGQKRSDTRVVAVATLRRDVAVKSFRSSTVLAVLGLMVLTACGNGGRGGGQEGTSLRWATSDVGSHGYRVPSYIADFLNRDLPDETFVTVHPCPDTTSGMKAVMDGEADVAHSADVDMLNMVDMGKEWAGHEPGTREGPRTSPSTPPHQRSRCTSEGWGGHPRLLEAR